MKITREGKVNRVERNELERWKRFIDEGRKRVRGDK